MPTKQAPRIYEFGLFRVDAAKRLLLRDGEPVPLTPKSFDILLALVETSGEVFGKDDLMKRIWPDSFVEEGNLTYNISMLRKALGEKASEHQYIVTIPGRGYQFSANVRKLSDDPPARSADLAGEAALQPEAQITDERIAGPRTYSVRRRWVILAGFALLLLAAAAIYFLRSKESGQPKSTVAIKSLAVLPFKPLVADRRNEELELGMAVTLINKLSSIRELVVRPISAVSKYSALNQDPLAAGRELGVDAVLDSSIQWDSENKIRVTTRLLRVGDGSTIWTDKCDEQCSNLFELQDSIAERVARAVSPRLTGGERELLAKRYTESYEAYELYVQGLYFWKMGTRQGIQKAIDSFQQAIGKDQNYALAYAGLANCYVLKSAEEGPREILLNAKEAATKALEIDNNLSEAHSTLGAVKMRLELDWPGAESEQKLAIALNPNNAIAHTHRGMSLATVGRFDEAKAEIKESLEIDPFSITTRRAVPLILYWSRRNDEAIAEYQKVIAMAPDFPLAQRDLGLAYEQKGLYQEALEQLQKSLALPGSYFKTMNEADIGHLYAAWGKTSEARKVLAELIHKSEKGEASAYGIAVILAGLGEKDTALEWLNKAYEDRSFWLTWIKNDPRLDGLRLDPRFTDLLRRMKIAS